jgi:hypothetical protein
MDITEEATEIAYSKIGLFVVRKVIETILPVPLLIL